MAGLIFTMSLETTLNNDERNAEIAEQVWDVAKRRLSFGGNTQRCVVPPASQSQRALFPAVLLCEVAEEVPQQSARINLHQSTICQLSLRAGLSKITAIRRTNRPRRMPRRTRAGITLSLFKTLILTQGKSLINLSLFKTLILTQGKSKGKGGWPARGRVPRRTCRRSGFCGF